MKMLLEKIKKIEDVLCSLEIILNQEYHNLLNANTNTDLLRLVVKKKNVICPIFQFK